MSASEFRRALEECDIEYVRCLWVNIFPGLPQPKNNNEALIILHLARTEAKSISFKLRAYSHRWLLDHGYLSRLPDELKPKAERLYPKIIEGVGIGTHSKEQSPLKTAIIQAMSDAVADAYAEGLTHPDFVRERMNAARSKVLRQ